MCTAPGLPPYNASCVCREGRQTTTFFYLLKLTRFIQSQQNSTRRGVPPGLTYLTHQASCVCRRTPNTRETLSVETILRRFINHPYRLMHPGYHACTSHLVFYRRKRGNGEQLHSAKRSLRILNNPMLTLRRGKHEPALSFWTCGEKGRVNGCTGKAPRRVDAYPRHMHSKHSTYSNRTCLLRAPFV